MKPADFKAIFGMPPQAAVEYLQRRGYAITWDWREQATLAHDRAATVAKAMRVGILQDIHGALVEAARDGLTLNQFTDRLTPKLQAAGWWGRQIHVNPAGQAEVVQLGSPRRLRTIYQTNLQSAYMSARWQQIEAAKATHPYVQYVAVLDSKTRPSHRAMHGRVFAVDDPIWQSHAPPNGYNCRCRVRPLSETAMKREGLTAEHSAGRLRARTVELGEPRPDTGESFQAKVTEIELRGADGKKRWFAPDPGFNSNGARDWLRPFTPPPAKEVDARRLPVTQLLRQALPALPLRAMPPAMKLPPGLPAGQYAQAFVSEFPAAKVWRDAVGEPLPISLDLFRDGAGAWAFGEVDPTSLRLAAEVLQRPAEIWLAWKTDAAGASHLVRRYVAGVVVDAKPQAAVFEWSDAGWHFGLHAEDVPAVRQGFLQYKAGQ